MTRFPFKLVAPPRFSRVIKRIAQVALAGVFVALPFGVLGGGGIGFSDAETLRLKALREVRSSKLDPARQTIDELLARYPNFRLAYLVQGDLWRAKAKPLLSLGDKSETADQLTGLRAEATARVQREKDIAHPEFIPANFRRLPASRQYALAMDVDKSRLCVLENQNGRLVRVADFYATIGKAGGGKAREGDQRTPFGAYTVTGTFSPQKLTDFYSAGAFPIDYPNAWDKPCNTQLRKIGQSSPSTKTTRAVI